MTTFERLKAELQLSLKPVIVMFCLLAIAQISVYIIIQESAQQPFNAVGRYFVFFIIVLCLYAVSGKYFQTSVVRAAEGMITRLRLRMAEKVRNADLKSFEDMGTADIRTAIASDINAVSSATHAFTQLGRSCAVMAASLLYIGSFSREILFFVLLTLGTVILLYALNQKAINRTMIAIRQKEKDFFSSVRHLLFGFKELKLNDKKNDDFFHKELKKNTAAVKKMRLQNDYRFIFHYNLTFLLWNVIFAFTAFMLPALGNFSIESVVKITGIILYMPLSAMAEVMPRLAEAKTAVGELFRIEDALDQLSCETAPKSNISPAAFTEIRYEDITFYYTDRFGMPTFSIGPLSLTIKAGEIIFLIGGNGSGKTTLLKILTGLYHPFSGRININGSLNKLHPSLFGVIFTDFYLFDRLYGIKNIDETLLNSLLLRFDLLHKTSYINGGFSSINLSSGQRKRLAMIAALMEKRMIYVFDEWAADQDEFFRDYFYLEILPDLKYQGKTVIAATHDDRYYHVADRVLRIEYGQFI